MILPYLMVELNFGDAKLWQMWRITIPSPNLTLQFLIVTAMTHAMLILPKFNPPNFYESKFVKVWHHQN